MKPFQVDDRLLNDGIYNFVYISGWSKDFVEAFAFLIEVRYHNIA